MKSFNAEQKKQFQTRIEKGTDIWPWPEGNSPKDNYRRNELKGRNMVCLFYYFNLKSQKYHRNTTQPRSVSSIYFSFKHKWQDQSAGSRWISIPQNERQDDDDEKDIPNEKDSLFVIQSHHAEESTTEAADSDDSTTEDEEEEEDEI